MFAYIPARIGSKRVPKKNIKHLAGKPIICHVIENLLQCPNLQGVAVSTDSDEVKQLVDKYDKVVTLSSRTSTLSGDDTGFMDLVKYDLDRFGQHFSSTDVLFTLATSALIKPHEYSAGIDKFNQGQHNLVMSVTEYLHHPMLALIEDETGHLSPLHPDAYLAQTKSLPKSYIDSGNFYVFNYKTMKQHNMFLEHTPIAPIVLQANRAIDVDTMDDWHRLEESYSEYEISR
ncbi:hypothetical protein CKO50_11160 [Pseudoalteromonas sp. HM-SA03]|uniref:acylneuraminate cytidylyltransferase family protein n=1 Tax=Pseudoalteromonas sp. HM-SA03 TaxID=2029678 RepID=UPI000BAE0165|nr:acylneuraminate cytidylyltransferase family protein [Pseudoalteromonas sp. HM-SA03]PAY01276.1 hypothetical protein CKO50_11160 [Pseudoalteromonas sp. HM-SA03]